VEQEDEAERHAKAKIRQLEAENQKIKTDTNALRQDNNLPITDAIKQIPEHLEM